MPKLRPAQTIQVAAATPSPRPRPATIAVAQSTSNTIEQRGLWPLEVASADPLGRPRPSPTQPTRMWRAAPRPQGPRRRPNGPPISGNDGGVGVKTDKLAGTFQTRFDRAMAARDDPDAERERPRCRRRGSARSTRSRSREIHAEAVIVAGDDIRRRSALRHRNRQASAEAPLCSWRPRHSCRSGRPRCAITAAGVAPAGISI